MDHVRKQLARSSHDMNPIGGMVRFIDAKLPRNDIQRLIASWGAPGTPTQDQAHYPTDFSRDIVPIPCHSHNDYWRKVPLYDALEAGCTSVEADVWLKDGDLLVGHTESSLQPGRSLRSLYLDPLLSVLRKENSEEGPTPFPFNVSGIFEMNPNISVTLLLDLKSDGNTTLQTISQQLEPLQAKGWLTRFDGSRIIPGPITVVGTGNTPFDAIQANRTRNVFFDAPLEDLWGENAPADRLRYSSQNSFYASTQFSKAIGKLENGFLKPKQVDTIRGQVQAASALGIKARYWDTPTWPIKDRDHVWDVLMHEGVGVLNVDDLTAASHRPWND
ncbi:MAG: hypothetical protein Q9166_007367 [cf. Caloplaca sp. 2 TL-2023]